MSKKNRSFRQIRTKVKKRDNYRCVRCTSKDDLTLHHIQKVEDGGDNSANNLMLICAICHQKWHSLQDIFGLPNNYVHHWIENKKIGKLLDKFYDVKENYKAKCKKKCSKITKNKNLEILKKSSQIFLLKWEIELMKEGIL